ncbi:MAG: restriction endonuclease subunit S [Hormoscilla sp. GM102CHS1]|nr:restriction endonuclease subunit S [Hormoscilla sp. GM102CHS1]
MPGIIIIIQNFYIFYRTIIRVIIWFKNFNKSINSKFVKLLYDTDLIQNQIKHFSAGGTVGTYTITNASRTKIPLPPLETQERIVADTPLIYPFSQKTHVAVEYMAHDIVKEYLLARRSPLTPILRIYHEIANLLNQNSPCQTCLAGDCPKHSPKKYSVNAH